jgi:hypothetical protein
MEKNTKMIIGAVLLAGGLYTASKTDNKNINVAIKEDVGNKTMSFIVAGIGAYLIYKSIK